MSKQFYFKPFSFAMAMKGYSTFPKAPALLEPHHQIASCHVKDTRCSGELTLLQRCSLCILQPLADLANLGSNILSTESDINR